jgi:hypothetical protein
MAKNRGKRMVRQLSAVGGAGLIGTLLGGIVGAIGAGIGNDIYHRITRRKRVRDEPEEE